MEQNFVIILYKYTLSHTRPLTSVRTKLHFRLGEFVMRSYCSKTIAPLCIKVRHWKDMNVDVKVEVEIILSVFEMPTRVTRVISRRMRACTNVLELCSPERSE